MAGSPRVPLTVWLLTSSRTKVCGVAWCLNITFLQLNEPVPKLAYPVQLETVEVNAFHSVDASKSRNSNSSSRFPQKPP